MSFTNELPVATRKQIIEEQIEGLLKQAYQMHIQVKVAKATDKPEMVDQLEPGLLEMEAVLRVLKEELSSLDN